MAAIVNWVTALAAAFALTRLPLALTRSWTSKPMRLVIAYTVGTLTMLALASIGFHDRPDRLWPACMRCLLAFLVLLLIDIADERRGIR